MPAAPIYLDHNATAPILPEVADAVRDAALRYPGNPASQHDLGRQARRALEAARVRIGELLGARVRGIDADQIIFTSGGTEANNLALSGILQRAWKSPPAAETGEPCLIISALEHPSIIRSAERLASLGVNLRILGVDPNGVIRVDQLEDLLPPPLVMVKLHPDTAPGRRYGQRLRLTSMMLADNETGVIQPIAHVSRLGGRRGVLAHTDATQAVGKIPVNFHELGVELLTAAAHKFHGPLGVGILIVRNGVELDPALHGGFQQAAMRPGTESVALAVGMQTALELAIGELEVRNRRMTELRDQLESSIVTGYPEAVVIGANSPRLPHTSNIAFVGLNRQALLMALDLAGVACSSGSACASGSSEPSPTLVAMGLPEAVVSSSIRFSLGSQTTAEDMAEATRRILAVCNRLRREK